MLSTQFLRTLIRHLLWPVKMRQVFNDRWSVWSLQRLTCRLARQSACNRGGDHRRLLSGLNKLMQHSADFAMFSRGWLLRRLRRLLDIGGIKRVTGTCRYYLTKAGRAATAAVERLTTATIIPDPI